MEAHFIGLIFFHLLLFAPKSEPDMLCFLTYTANFETIETGDSEENAIETTGSEIFNSKSRNVKNIWERYEYTNYSNLSQKIRVL